MTTRLTDVLEPAVWEAYIRLRTTELSAFWQSGVVATDRQLDQRVQGGGTLIEMPHWNALAGDARNIGSDDPASSATAKKITTGKDQAIKHMVNQMWGSADLLASVVGEDPMGVIVDEVAGYWAREMQGILIASVQGAFADNVANDSGDMVYDIATDSAAAVTDAERISAEALLQAMQTAGDASGVLRAFATHSQPCTKLKTLNLIDFVPDSEGNTTFGRYLDKTLIMDDGMPAVAGSNRITYSTYLFGPGAFALGEGQAKVPVEVDRKPEQGDGAGVENLHSRREFILHPRGVGFVSGSMAGESPTDAELALAANWDRVYDRKLVRLAELQTNG
ncbi:MAG: hypothetical protein GY716_15670 [bacterium]|nr:hypothetical protein [bacterium]